MEGSPEKFTSSGSANAAGPRRRPTAAHAYVWCVVAVAVAASVWWALAFGFSLGPTTLAVGLALAALCATERRQPVSLGVGKASFEFGSVPIFSALILGGPACALLAAAPSAAHRDPSRTAFQGAIHALQILAGSLVFSLLAPLPFLASLSNPDGGPPFSAAFVWGTLAAGVAYFGLDALIGPVLMRLKYGLRWREVLVEIVLPALPSDVVAVAAALIMALAAASFGPSVALFLIFGTALSLAATNLVREPRKKILRLEAKNGALREALRESNAELAVRLVGRLGSRDGHAAAHAAASAVYAFDVAREMGLGEDRSARVHLAALLMDVGLLWVADEVLLTPPANLNSLGRMRLQEHPAAGEEVLSAVPGLGPEAAKWVRWHHERPDGAGYPDRLRGEWTPIEAKILAAASLYASLVLDGPHSPGLGIAEARRVLVGGMDKPADATVVKALLLVLDSKDTSYAAASDARFSYPAGEVASPAIG